ncbi:hypothetical protein GE09DRAFT_1158221 [Coniochaeta sp. 2T2.1]|nr:hypothetical protein GE09DRAFT_1158221 [Coniochaeta sp. 2T2.1]
MAYLKPSLGLILAPFLLTLFSSVLGAPTSTGSFDLNVIPQGITSPIAEPLAPGIYAIDAGNFLGNTSWFISYSDEHGQAVWVERNGTFRLPVSRHKKRLEQGVRYKFSDNKTCPFNN